jgi:uncharacterized protein YkwD
MKDKLKYVITRTALTAALFSILFSLFLNGAPAANSQPKKKTSLDIAGIEREFLARINLARKKRGLQLLRDDKALNRVSLAHSLKMAGEGELSHTFPGYKSLGERLREAGAVYRRAGENVAYCKPYLLDTVHEGFMESPVHRDNILDPNFTHCSVKVAKKGSDIYITQEFAQLVSSLPQYGNIPKLEQDLTTWFKKEYKSRITLLPTAGKFARFCAEENLKGRRAPGAHEKWGDFYVVNLISPGIKDIKKKLMKQAGRINFQGAVVGAAAGAHPDYPAGAYSVTALLFPGNKYSKKSPEKLIKYVLQEVNKIRGYNRCRSLKYDKVLSQRALETAQLYYNYPEDSLRYPDAQKVRIYRAGDIRTIPSKFTGFLTGLKQGGRVGIGIFAPLKYRLPGNFFIIAIIIDN